MMSQTLPTPLDVKLMNWTATVLFLGCAAFVLAAGARWALRNPAFAIQRIVVQGDLAHNNALTLRASVQQSLVGNFFTVDLKAVRAAFEQAPWVRTAEIRREYPGVLRVDLQEHDATAHWGPENATTMLDSTGEVFEATAGDAEEDLPRLQGPEGQSAQVLAMYRQLELVLKPLGSALDELSLSTRGGWRAELGSGATVELGSGTRSEVAQRAESFVRTLPQVTAQYRRRVDALESADLRHSDGYAVRLQGVTVAASPEDAEKMAKAAASKAKAKAQAQAAKPKTPNKPTTAEGRH